MGDVFELPIVKAIKEIEELAQTIKAKKNESEDFKSELKELKRKCLKYNLNFQDYYTSERDFASKGMWG